MKRQIVNIVNFIRGTEPRLPMDLVTPVKEQLKLLEKYDLSGTFLLQYDALMDPIYTDMLKAAKSDKLEFGIWLEIVQPLVEKAGIPWHGRYSWDWHAHCGFSVGYTLEEREKIVDVIMEDFKKVFGFYPRSLGSWAFDAHIIKYISDKYGLDATCNCKEQWGTDGYTLWGGYYNQGYYPSKNNIYSPAQTKESQIDVPVFRMLGPDPIYQYDFGLDLDDGASGCQGVVTLEPVYCGSSGGGGISHWVDWYFKENFSGDCLTFGYTQAGQENSFGWDAMEKGLTYQIEQLAKLQAEGKIEIETLKDTGIWFKNTFTETPPSTMVATTDWKNEGHRTVWYNCKNYRINIFAENDRFWIRDIYLFDENYRERYFEQVCTTDYLQFDTLPVMDGNRWSGHGIRAGVYPMVKCDDVKAPLTFSDMEYSEHNGNAIVSFKNTECGDIIFNLTENGFTITAKKDNNNFILVPRLDKKSLSLPDLNSAEKNELKLCHNNFDYSIKLTHGSFDDDCVISAEDGIIGVSGV